MVDVIRRFCLRSSGLKGQIILTAQSIVAALSTTLAGLVMAKAGYSAGFLVLGSVAAIGSVICRLALPETPAAFGTELPGQTKPRASAIAAG